MDPIIQFPANSQSLNPYSYLMNNPMAGTDPTGYTCSTGTKISGHTNCDTLGARVHYINSPGGKDDNGARRTQMAEGVNRAEGGTNGQPEPSTIGTVSNQVEVTAKLSSQAHNVPEGAAATVITERVRKNFISDPSQPVDIDWEREFMVVARYDATRPDRYGVPGMPLDEFGEFIRGPDGDSSFARSALDGAFYNIRGGPLNGVHQGSDVNYYHQGFVWAAQGLPRAAMDAAIATHNLNDAAQARDRAERMRNLGQIGRARAWAGWGYDYYQERPQ